MKVLIYSSIKKLNVENNLLGRNENNRMYLRELLKINTSILKLNLRCNDLGRNEKNMMYLSKVLKINS